MSRFSLLRLLSRLRWISPLDRVAIAVIVICLLERIPIHFGIRVPLSSLFVFLSFAAVAYLLIRLVPWARKQLLWRLRNRLIVAYVFIAVVPVVLLMTIVGLGLVLLELQIGAHLFRDDLETRISVIASDADAIAAALEREPGLHIDQPVPLDSRAVVDPALLRPGVANIIAAAQAEWPDLRAYLNHGSQLVRAENGRQFAGLTEFRNQLWFASAKSIDLPNGHATLLVLAPLTTALLDSFPSKLGPIQISLLEPTTKEAPGAFSLNGGQFYVFGQTISSKTRTLAPKSNWFDMRIPGGATLEVSKADTGGDATPRPVWVTFSLRASAINRDLLSSVGYLGPLLVQLLLIAALVFLLLETAALATGVVLTRTITRSVADLYDGTLHVRRGDFSHRVRVARRDQLGSLAESFNDMTSSITELIEEQRQRQKLEHEVAIAREVQQQLFPHNMPRVPGLDVAAICRPARVVSGDYYDFIPLGPGRIGIALADISGKGIFAALLMASLQAALRSTASLDGKGGTSELVSRLNEHLFKNTSDDRYATFFYSVYDANAKTLTYTNAGHLAPVFLSDGKVQSLSQGGTVVGLFEEVPYTQCTIPVKPGSLLVGFSDGLTEPESVYGEEFGVERLQAEILRQKDLPASRLAENLVAAAEQWAGTAEQADDMTVVVARMT
jgi:phosphoserine phosphatase RsbU/P